jgi:predicted nucleic acid-binding protein
VILVDTSVWIDHLHSTEPELVTQLGEDQVGSHPAVIEELALGAIKDRTRMLGLLADLWSFPNVSHAELLELVDQRRLWGRGLSAVDAHLLGAVALVPGGRLWTRDQRLRAACRDLGLGWIDG